MRNVTPPKPENRHVNDRENTSINRNPDKPKPMPLKIFRGLLSVLTGGIIVVSLLTAVGMWRFGDRFFAGLMLMIQPPEPEHTVDVRSVVVRQIREASELTTAVFAMEAVVPTSSDRTLVGYVIGKTNLLYLAYGEVRAGVDLSELADDNVQVTDESIRVLLPPPRILDAKIDVARSNVYDYDRGFLGLGPDTAPELQNLAQKEALRKIVSSACAEGILKEANQRAELVVKQLLATAGYEDIAIETQPSAPETCP
ncbi:MAG: DUF4230 domain-containing protein [Pseudanabaenales cyanobacterium]|nr:DUF4230 domain-containing protein [Pseudanabaenales cyanobacterium]